MNTHKTLHAWLKKPFATLDLFARYERKIWWRTINQARGRWAEVDGDQRAAAFGFYFLLSLLPLILLLVSAGSLFVEREVASHAVINLLNLSP